MTTKKDSLKWGSRTKIIRVKSQLPHIPDEIIVEILSRLPVKSLLRCKSVCKKWYTAIKDPNFVLSNRCRQRAIFVWNNVSYTASFRSINHQLRYQRIYDPFEGVTNLPRLLGSCNGLLLVGFGKDIFLWNPSLGCQTKIIEMKSLKSLKRVRLIVSGLCYDSSTDDYKALMLLRNFYGGIACFLITLRGIRCREITFPVTNKFRRVCGGPVVHDQLHWSFKDKIMSFDPISDAFKELPIPDPKHGEHNVIVGLGVLDGCLCMANKIGNRKFELLIMEEYGVKNSWMRRFSWDAFTPRTTELIPLFFTEKGGISIDIDGRLFVYDPKTGKAREMPTSIHGHVGLTYEESLAWPTEIRAWPEEV